MGEGLTLNLPSDLEYTIDLNKNLSLLISTLDGDVTAEADPDYEQFLADVWVGIVLTFMVCSCVCCMGTCLLYHKFQQWKAHVLEQRNAANLDVGAVEAELPSYTIASGLPSYQEALEQLKKVKELAKPPVSCTVWVPQAPPTPPTSALSVMQLFEKCKGPDSDSKPC